MELVLYSISNDWLALSAKQGRLRAPQACRMEVLKCQRLLVRLQR